MPSASLGQGPVELGLDETRLGGQIHGEGPAPRQGIGHAAQLAGAALQIQIQMGPAFIVRASVYEMHPLNAVNREKYLKEKGGLGYCNITKCCTEVCPEDIKITDNAIKIAREGQELYNRLTTFVDRLADVGKNLKKSVTSYNRAMGSLDKRLLPAVRRFQEMGLSTTALDAPQEIEIQPTSQPTPENNKVGEDDHKQ